MHPTVELRALTRTQSKLGGLRLQRVHVDERHVLECARICASICGAHTVDVPATGWRWSVNGPQRGRS